MSIKPPLTAAVQPVFENYPPTIREQLLAFRDLIYTVAAETDGVGALEETLKWGQISYLTPVTKSGTTIRIDAVSDHPEQVAMFVHCQTTLVDGFRAQYGSSTAVEFEGNRCARFKLDDQQSLETARDCIAAALTYHQHKKQ